MDSNFRRLQVFNLKATVFYKKMELLKKKKVDHIYSKINFKVTYNFTLEEVLINILDFNLK